VALHAITVVHLYFLLVLQSFVGHIKLARLNYKRKDRAHSVQLLEEVQAQWSANLHLKLLTLIQEVDEFVSGIKGTLKNLEIFSIWKVYEDIQSWELLSHTLLSQITR
jgi:hypothetical protein